MSESLHVASVGNITIGKGAPLVLQSMTNTDTNDIAATVAQVKRIFDAGAQMVRVSTQGMKEVESLRKVRDELCNSGYTRPLVADVHFLPKVAEEAAKIVEKVRINPGNYMPKEYSGTLRYNGLEQKKQMEIIRERLLPLIDICREHGTAIRVGVNHGSLSKRILSWFGNTAQGMVESAHEFIRVFHDEDFHNIVVSLKSSDARQMIIANRLLVQRMYKENMSYPIHLGVTEAGADEEGRIKSSVGISTLLADGIGDTIRVSLTEEPEKELSVSKIISDYFFAGSHVPNFIVNRQVFWNPFEYKRRLTLPTDKIGGHHELVVICTCREERPIEDCLTEAGHTSADGNTFESDDDAADFIFLEGDREFPYVSRKLQVICNRKTWDDQTPGKTRYYPLISSDDYGLNIDKVYGMHFIRVKPDVNPEFFEDLDNELFGILLLELSGDDTIADARIFFKTLWETNTLLPVIIHRKYQSKNLEELMVKASGELGSLLCDGYGDGIWIEDENPDISLAEIRNISFNILQSTGTRISRTEYISCPSCGRTLFNIQESLKKVKVATRGMKGLKIAVMGCIVNGPGELAGADYGYVGAGPGKINLYKGELEVKKNIPEGQAVEELVELIRENESVKK